MADQTMLDLQTAGKQASSIGAKDLLIETYDPAGSPDDKVINLGSVMREMYKIAPSVSSNNLSVAIQHLDASNPASTNPLAFKVGGTWYVLTASTSYTKNAGTNWCNAGGAELATKEIDFFVYAIGETGASAGLKFGHSRIPGARVMGDFVNTSTSEKYIAGNWTNFNATDSVAVIGRFAATLSAGAGYTWTVPTYTNANLIQSPTFETRWLDFIPTLTGFSANPTTTVYRYKIRLDTVTLFMRQGGNGTSDATTFTATLPISAKVVTNHVWQSLGLGVDNGATAAAPCVIAVFDTSTNKMDLYKDSALTAWTNSGGKRIGQMNPLVYEI